MGVTRYNVKRGVRGELQGSIKIDERLSPTICGAFSHDAERLALGHFSGRITCWNVLKGQMVENSAEDKFTVFCTTFSAGDSRIVFGVNDFKVRVWSQESEKLVPHPLVGHTDNLSCGRKRSRKSDCIRVV